MYLNGNRTEFSPYTTIPYNSLCNGNDWARNIATPTVGGPASSTACISESYMLWLGSGSLPDFAAFRPWDMRAVCNIHMGLSSCCVAADLAGMHYYVSYGPSEAQYTQSLVSCLSCTPPTCTAACRQFASQSCVVLKVLLCLWLPDCCLLYLFKLSTDVKAIRLSWCRSKATCKWHRLQTSP